MFVVWAKTDNEDIRGFILERSMAGITTPYVVAIRSIPTSLIVCDRYSVKENVPIPLSNSLLVTR